jgi:hypothetical protein
MSKRVIQTPMHTPESYDALGDRPPRPRQRRRRRHPVPGVIAFITGEILHIDGGQIAGH